jgi:hypothetical protein
VFPVTSSNVAQPRASRTNSKDKKDTQQIREEASDIKNVVDGASYLMRRQLTVADMPVALGTLVETLFHVTQMQVIPLQVKNVICSIAFLLEEVDNEKKAAVIADAVVRKMDERLRGAQEELEEAKIEYVQMQVLRDDCMRLIQQQQERFKEMAESFSNIIPTVHMAVGDAMSTISASMAEDVSKTIGDNLMNTTSPYRDALM